LDWAGAFLGEKWGRLGDLEEKNREFGLDLDFWVKNGDFGGCDWTPGF